MERVTTSRVVARATHPETAYVPPGTGINGLLDGDVITERVVCKGAVRGHPDPLKALGTRV
jgi:hypothetical protein